MDEGDVSSVSLVSGASTATSVFQPKPPGGPKPASQSFARSSKASGKVVRSPYLATSTPLLSKKPRLHSQQCSNNEVAQGVPIVWTSPSVNRPHPSVSTFLQSLMKTPGFSAVVNPNNPRRKVVGNNQYKAGSISYDVDAIQLRDQLVHLQKEMNAMKKEKDIAKAQQIRLSKEVAKKDKQIEDLMAAGHVGTRDAVRSLTKLSIPEGSLAQPKDSRKNAALVLSLRQQVHSLERALRERELEVGELKRGVTASQLREMEIQSETYYKEICRLNHILQDYFPAIDTSVDGVVNPITPRSASEARIKLKALEQATVKMSSKIESLEEENGALKRKLEMSCSMPSAVPAESIQTGEYGSVVDRYQDHNRSQMLSAIVELEMKCVQHQKDMGSLLEEQNKEKASHERAVEKLRNDLVEASSTISTLKSELCQLHDSEKKLKSVVSHLKDDRTHYRKAAEHTQCELQTVQERLGKEELGREEIIKELQSLQKDYQSEMLAIEHSRKLAKKHSKIFTPDKDKQDGAACTIQQHWRKRQAMARQERYQKESEDAIIDIQSALKAHLARKKKLLLNGLSQPSLTAYPEGGLESEEDADSEDSSEAIEMIQSAMKGYLTRQMVLQDYRQRDTKLGQENGYRPTHPIQSSTSSLSRYHPPLHTPNHDISFANTKSGKPNNSISPWKNYVKWEDQEMDKDFQSRTYLTSSTESEPNDPDKSLLMDEFK